MSNIELTWHTFKKQAFWKKEEPEPMPGDYLGRIYGGLAGGGVGAMGGAHGAKLHYLSKAIQDMQNPLPDISYAEDAIDDFSSTLKGKDYRSLAMSNTAPTDMANKWREFLAKYKPGMENMVPDASHFSKLDKAMQKNMRRFGIGGAVLGIGGGVGLGALLDKHRKDSRRNSLNKRAFFGRKEEIHVPVAPLTTLAGGAGGYGLGVELGMLGLNKQLKEQVDIPRELALKDLAISKEKLQDASGEFDFLDRARQNAFNRMDEPGSDAHKAVGKQKWDSAVDKLHAHSRNTLGPSASDFFSVDAKTSKTQEALDALARKLRKKFGIRGLLGGLGLGAAGTVGGYYAGKSIDKKASYQMPEYWHSGMGAHAYNPRQIKEKSQPMGFGSVLGSGLGSGLGFILGDSGATAIQRKLRGGISDNMTSLMSPGRFAKRKPLWALAHTLATAGSAALGGLGGLQAGRKIDSVLANHYK